MRKPKDYELVRCPEARSKRTHKPAKVFEDGTFGILGQHSHGYAVPSCPYSKLPVRIIPREAQ